MSSFKDLIPNPFSNKESLAGLIKKTVTISSWLSFVSAAKQIIVLIVIVFIVHTTFNIPTLPLAILFVLEFIIILISTLISFLKIKEINKINYQSDASSSWKILLIIQYYATLTSIISAITNTIGIFCFIFILESGVINLNIPLNFIPYIEYFLFFIIFSKLWGVAMSLIKYSLTKKVPNDGDIANLDRNYSLINAKFSIIGLLGLLVVMILFAVILLFSGIIPRELIIVFKPVFLFCIPFFIFIILFVVYDFFSYKKLKELNFNDSVNVVSDKRNNQDNLIKISEYQDEKILGSIFGIERSMASFKDIFSRKMGSYQFLGVGQNFAPENTLLITNYRMLFIQVSVTGGDKVIGETDYVAQNMLFNRSEIVKKGEELLKNNSISQITSLVRNEVLYQDIANLTFNKFIININKINGEKLRYAFMDKEYADLINRILPEYLGDKFVSK
jgi:hypothetical protein